MDPRCSRIVLKPLWHDRRRYPYRSHHLPILFDGEYIYLTLECIAGLVSSTMQEQFDNLRKGRSRVLVKRHTLIIGYQREKVISIVQVTVLNIYLH
jgi:hypothetical protein